MNDPTTIATLRAKLERILTIMDRLSGGEAKEWIREALASIPVPTAASADDPTRYTRAAVAYGATLRKDESRPDHWICTMPNGDNCTGDSREAAAEIMCLRHCLTV